MCFSYRLDHDGESHTADIAQLLFVQALKAFEEFLSPNAGGFSFNRFIPMPDNIFFGDLRAGSPEETSGNNWLAWRRTHWNTKWECDQVKLETHYHDEHGHLMLEFRNPWNPPYPIIDFLKKSQSEIEFVMKFEPDVGTGRTEIYLSDPMNDFHRVMQEEQCLPDDEWAYRPKHFFIDSIFLARWNDDDYLGRAMELLSDHHGESLVWHCSEVDDIDSAG